MRAIVFYMTFVLSLSQGVLSHASPRVESLQFEVSQLERNGTVSIQMSNLTERLIRIWKESNSWGAAHWRVLIVRNGHLHTFFQNPDQFFTKNVPAFIEIPPKGHLGDKLNLNGGNWCSKEQCANYDDSGIGGQQIRFEPGDTIIVIYDVPRSNESTRFGVWYGVAAASTTVQ
jgi:hypothetical protein